MEYVMLDSFLQIIQNVLGSIFDAVLSPVLRDAFNAIVNLIGELLQSIFVNWLLKILVTFLKLINFLEGIFNAFAGVSPVKVQDVSEEITLLEYFFRVDTVQRVFLGITALAVVLAFMATLFAVIRSMADAPFEDRHPLSTVLTNAIRAAVTFMVIPITCLFVLQVSTKSVAAINQMMNANGAEASLSDTLFITVAGSAAKSPVQENIKKFSSGQKYEDMESVKRCFDIKKINYTQAYVSCFMLFFVMIASILAFIQRIFIILTLYLVSPFFVAMMPIDGGAKFKEWRDVFVAHVISAFGPILVMKLYLLLMPILVSDKMVYSETPLLAEAVKLLLLIGGAFAVYSSRTIIVTILSPSAGATVAQSGIIASFLGAKMMGAARKGISGAGRSKSGSKGGKSGGSGGKGGDSSGGSGGSSGGGSGSQAYKGHAR